MYCKNCGTELVEGAKFCRKCGAKVESEIPADDPKKVSLKKNVSEEKMNSNRLKNCPNCGAEIIEGMKFCQSCGTKLESGITSDELQKISLDKDLGNSKVNNTDEPKHFAYMACDNDNTKNIMGDKQKIDAEADEIINKIKEDKKRNKKKIIIAFAVTGIAVLVLISAPTISYMSKHHVDSISFQYDYTRVKIDGYAELTYDIYPENSNCNVTFESSDESIATVDNEGYITPVDSGKCEITVSAGEEEDTMALFVDDIENIKDEVDEIIIGSSTDSYYSTRVDYGTGELQLFFFSEGSVENADRTHWDTIKDSLEGASKEIYKMLENTAYSDWSATVYWVDDREESDFPDSNNFSYVIECENGECTFDGRE